MIRGTLELGQVALSVEDMTNPNGGAMPGAKVLVIQHPNPDGTPLTIFVPMPADAAKAIGALLQGKPPIEVPGIVIPGHGGPGVH